MCHKIIYLYYNIVIIFCLIKSPNKLNQNDTDNELHTFNDKQKIGHHIGFKNHSV